MQTQISQRFRNNADIEHAESILRKCVHCGFCLATCPTYNLLGDELDSPRGRIYLIKRVLEGHQPTARTQLHLDRCLTCRNCETTCPSGVEYGHLLDTGRHVVDAEVSRSWRDRLLRRGLLSVLPYPSRIGLLVRIGQRFRPLLPADLKSMLPARRPVRSVPAAKQLQRRMLVLGGCVQPSMMPSTNAAAARVLQRLGIDLIEIAEVACCAAINHHLNDREVALQRMRDNIDAWWPELERGAEAIVMTASGCGAMVKDYGHLLRDDPAYATKAEKISASCRDIAEILAAEDLQPLNIENEKIGTVAFHPPCTLQHGQKLEGITERLLLRFGFSLTDVPDAHVCCGSAGTYSITQKKLSRQLQAQKVRNLESGKPSVITTANIGCQLHIQSVTGTPVVHWIELLADSMGKP